MKTVVVFASPTGIVSSYVKRAYLKNMRFSCFFRKTANRQPPTDVRIQLQCTCNWGYRIIVYRIFTHGRKLQIPPIYSNPYYSSASTKQVRLLHAECIKPNNIMKQKIPTPLQTCDTSTSQNCSAVIPGIPSPQAMFVTLAMMAKKKNPQERNT